MSDIEGLVRHIGGCHCSAVRFEMWTRPLPFCYQCRCSICRMKKCSYVLVPSDKFKLLQGENSIKDYRFNKLKAVHKFCVVCGVQSFYIPRSPPNHYAVVPHCLDDVIQVEMTSLDERRASAPAMRSKAAAEDSEILCPGMA